jgi:secreted Zn-dependent insulinase-like peptidase
LLKSATDQRQYEHFILPNGMRVLLVEDLKCQKSACSATLNVGHFDDYDDCHGLSHLLEHLLFLGNTSFPQANALNDFVAQHGGSINASTGTEYTSYFYDVLNEHLDMSLSQFSAMLSSPLLTETYIEKEILAIDAEFLLKQKDDLRRLYQVHKETCNPQHPFSKFSVGNKQTFAKFTPSQLKIL